MIGRLHPSTDRTALNSPFKFLAGFYFYTLPVHYGLANNRSEPK